MKNIYIIILIQILLSYMKISYAQVFPMKDRIKSYEFVTKHQKELFENQLHRDQSYFYNRIKTLPKRKKKEVISSIKELDSTLPSKILKSFVYWNFIEKNNDLVKKTLSYYMFYNALVLRDYIENPLTATKDKKKAKKHLQILYKFPNKISINQFNLAKNLIPYFNQISSKIAESKTIKNKIKKIKSNIFLTQDLQNIFPDITTYLTSPFGYIQGNKKNKTTYSNNDSKYLIDIIKNTKRSLVLDISFLEKQKDFSAIEFLIKHLQTTHQKNKQIKVIISTNKQDKSPHLLYLEKKLSNNRIISKNLKIMKREDLVRHPAQEKLQNYSLSFFKSKEKIKSKQNNSKIFVDANLNESKMYHYDEENNLQLYEGPIVFQYQKLFFKENIKNKIERDSDLYQYFLKGPIHISLSGKETVRFTNTSQSRTNIIIEMIQKANSNIYLDHFYIFNSDIIDSLIKRKIEKPNIRIKILTDSNEHLNYNGAPNTLFLKDLTKHKIEVRARRESKLSQNISSIDGKALLLTPSLDISKAMTNLQIFNTSKISNYDQAFLNEFYNKEKTVKLDIENFNFQVGNKRLDLEDSRLINGIGSLIIRNHRNYSMSQPTSPP